MRYLKLYENFNEKSIHKICKKYGIKNYTINDDGSIDVDVDVSLYGEKLTKLPLKFRNVIGSFNCGRNKLTTLENCPKSVNGDFNCSYNELTSLENCPESVGGDFNCKNNQLTSLESCPKFINDNFQCSHNQLTSIKFMPYVKKIFIFDNNNVCDFIGFIEPGYTFYSILNPVNEIWKLFKDTSYIELLNEYDCIRGEDIVIDRLNQFLEEIDKPAVESVEGYNNI